MILIQRLRTHHTPTGNPQRLFLVMRAEDGSLERVIVEGHKGRQVVASLDGAIELPEIDVTPQFYHHLVRGNAPWPVEWN